MKDCFVTFEVLRKESDVYKRQLNNIAEANINTIMPGYTHLQRAQPVTLAHHVLAYCEMFKRDIDRLDDTYRRTNVMPLGSGALAGTTYPLDRQAVCDALGFESITKDSMDAVSYTHLDVYKRQVV